MSDELTKVWDEVSKSYTNVITDFEYQFNNELIRLFDSFMIGEKLSLLELGSGSGHLSFLMAQHGHDVTLFDLSDVALEKSKELFGSGGVNGHFFKGDFRQEGWQSSLKPEYDIVWNSGVLEHYGTVELVNSLREIKKIGAKKYVFIVPNYRSFPYLLYRYFMVQNNRWDVGMEYIRGDYARILESCGYRKVYEVHLGVKWTEKMIAVFTDKAAKSFPYSQLVEAGIIDDRQNYLTAYIAENGPASSDYSNQYYDHMTELLDEIYKKGSGD